MMGWEEFKSTGFVDVTLQRISVMSGTMADRLIDAI